MEKEKNIIIITPISPNISYYEKIWRESIKVDFLKNKINNEEFKKLYMLQVDDNVFYNR